MNPRQKSALTKIFAIAGAVLLWAPILFMLLTGVVGSIASKRLLMDYLLLAEVFPIIALGLVLLVIATLLARTFRKLVGWGSVAALVALTAGQVLAVTSGLASGALAEGGGIFVTVIASIVIYNVLVVALAILAILLLRRIFRKEPEKEAEA